MILNDGQYSSACRLAGRRTSDGFSITAIDACLVGRLGPPGVGVAPYAGVEDPGGVCSDQGDSPRVRSHSSPPVIWMWCPEELYDRELGSAVSRARCDQWWGESAFGVRLPSDPGSELPHPCNSRVSSASTRCNWDAWLAIAWPCWCKAGITVVSIMRLVMLSTALRMASAATSSRLDSSSSTSLPISGSPGSVAGLWRAGLGAVALVGGGSAGVVDGPVTLDVGVFPSGHSPG
jgi:hypothetical protein